MERMKSKLPDIQLDKRDKQTKSIGHQQASKVTILSALLEDYATYGRLHQTIVWCWDPLLEFVLGVAITRTYLTVTRDAKHKVATGLGQ